MRKVTITLTDTPTGEDPYRVSIVAEIMPKPGPNDTMTPAMCMAAAALEFIEAHAKQDKHEVEQELAKQMPEGIPPHLN